MKQERSKLGHKQAHVTLKLAEDNQRIAHLCGVLDANLRKLETLLKVTITRRSSQFNISAIEATQAEFATKVLQALYQQAHEVLTESALYFCVKEMQHMDKLPPPTLVAISNAESQETSSRQRPLVKPRTPNQRQYLEQISTFDITLGIGPAGTGKTFLAVASAVQALERDNVNRLILTRPAVEAGERLGFLPGDLAQKIDPYLRPLFDALFDLIGFEKTQKLMEKGIIEVAPLAFMRGRSLQRAFVILDEAQNTTIEQMKMFLTRLGHGSKMVVNGDITQIDLPHGIHSGFIHAQKTLSKVEGVAITEFHSGDILRHPLVARIVEAYNAAQKK